MRTHFFLNETCVYANLVDEDYVDIVPEHHLKMTYRIHQLVDYYLQLFRL